RSVLCRHVALDVGETAVQVPETRADIASCPRRRCSNPLPELPILRSAVIELAGLGRGDPSRDEVEGQNRTAAHEDGGEKTDADKRDGETRIIGDPGANPHELAIL